MPGRPDRPDRPVGVVGGKGELKGGRWLTVEISGVKWGINTAVCAQSLLMWFKSFKPWGRGDSSVSRHLPTPPR